MLEFDAPVRTVEAASAVAGVPLAQIVKTLLVVDENGEVAACLLRGDRRLDMDKAAEALGVRRLRLANGKEVREATGYPVGAVPPVGLPPRLRALMDPEVEALEAMVAGGGTTRALVRLSTKDVLRVSRARVVPLAEASPSTG